ncbi:MAG: RDD family protein, partial [Dehalococcoidia bacterium]
GDTIGLKLAGARIVRENGDLSGFFHTFVRSMAASLSALPLGLGYWWAFWDPWRQTWHDKIMHTYVLRNTDELASRPGSSSGAAVAWFWVLLLLPIVLFFLFVMIVLAALAAA